MIGCGDNILQFRPLTVSNLEILVEDKTPLQPEKAAHTHHPALDVQEYLQHDLDDEPDPEVRVIKSQENVRTILRIKDDIVNNCNM